MKITEYPSTNKFNSDNILLLDGGDGTKSIQVVDAILSALDLISVENHRNFYRGKNLGTSFTTAQKAAIQAGTFDDMWVGDYWVINGINWRIVDIDYWFGTGDNRLNSHHIVVMPDSSLYEAAMNDNAITTGAYVGSKMYTTNLAEAKSTINKAFPSSVLKHRDFLTNAVTDNYASAGAWYDSLVEIPSETMIFGAHIHTPNDPSAKLYSTAKTQLALFRLCPRRISTAYTYWLRDVVSNASFASVDYYGACSTTKASVLACVRPVFAVG